MTSLRVDAHHHFWDLGVAPYSWMTDEFAAIQRNFGPADLRGEITKRRIDGTILVQTRSSAEETRHFLKLATSIDFIWGVIGWVDLTDPAIGEELARLRTEESGRFLVGIRHQVEEEPDPDWLRRPDVRRGLSAVADQGLTFDLLIRPREMQATIETVRAIPQLRFVVDHIAKPAIREQIWEPWAACLSALGSEQNVSCKLSGMVTEANWTQWMPEDLRPYVDHCIDTFGPDRLLYGSDWPVCLLAASYARVEEVLVGLLPAEPSVRARIFGENAIGTYALRPRLDASSAHPRDRTLVE